MSADSLSGPRPVDSEVRLPAGQRWLLHHRTALTETLERLRADAAGTLLVAFTLGVALALPGLLGVAVARLDDLAADWTRAPRLNVFVDVESGAGGAEPALVGRLRAREEIAAVDWQAPDASLAEFAAAAGFGDALGPGLDALGALGGNPLPGVALVTPAADVRAPARLRALAARLGSEPGVAGVQIDLDWVLRLGAALDLVGRLVWGLAALLASGVLLIVGSLTRGALERRREAIAVLRLVGGSDAFVRRPFVYEGALLGAAGGLVAWGLLTVTLALVAGPVEALARSYGSAFRLDGPGAAAGPGLVLAAAALGWLGARIAAGRALRAFEG